MTFFYSLLLSLIVFSALSFAAEVEDRYRFQGSNADISDKPSIFDSTKTATKKCKEMSRRALASNTNVLVIGFEGLVSADHFGTLNAYRYEKDLADKKPNAIRPLPSVIDGWLLHGLMIPLIKETSGGVKTLNFPHYGQGLEGSAPGICAEIWLSEPEAKNRKLVILGHSMGGLSAGLLARELKKKSLTVDLLVTMDPPVQVWRRPKNIKRWENYQGFLPIYINGFEADLQRYIFNPFYSNHFTMTHYPEIFDSVSRQVIQMMEKKPELKKPVPEHDYYNGDSNCRQCINTESAR